MRPPWTLPLARRPPSPRSLLARADTACSDDHEPPPPGAESRGIDAAAYYEDYESPEDDDGAVDGADSRRAEDAAAAAPAGPRAARGQHVRRRTAPAASCDAAADARSTFALDVDTGSFGVARTLLGQGYRPPPASIRVEEWVNAFELRRPARPPTPTSASPPSRRWRRRLDDGTQLVRVGVTAREVDREPSGRAVNVTLVVDRSGSMDIRERLGLVQSSLALLADRLRRRRHRLGRLVRGRGHADPRADAGPRHRRDPRRDRGAQARRQHQPRGRAAARLRAGARGASTTTPSNLVVLCLRRRRQRRRTPAPARSSSGSPRRAPTASTWSPSATAWATTTTT